MPSEDETDIPDRWRQVVHPRRHGLIGLVPLPRDGGDSSVGAGRDDGLAERVLGGSDLDPELVRLVCSGHPSVAADAVRLVLGMDPVAEHLSHYWSEPSLAPLDELIADRGLAHAAGAFVESSGYVLVWTPSTSGLVLTLHRIQHLAEWEPGWWAAAARHLRWALAVAPQERYDEAVAALAPLRGVSPRHRIALSYLMPDQREWVNADLAELPARAAAYDLLAYSAATAGQLSRFAATSLEHFVTALDAVGAEAVVPLITDWLDAERWSPDTRRDALEVLTRIPGDAAFETMLRRIDVPDVAGGVLAAADRFPRRAARILARRRDDDHIGVLFLRHVRAHPDVPEAALAPLAPEAPAHAVPRLLLSPPWIRKPPARITVPPSPLAAEPRIAWRDGERDEWAYDWREFTAEEMRKHLPLAEKGSAPAEFYTLGPAELVRPRLAKWQAESTWFYLQDPCVIVGKYELDAMTPMLRLARRKPAVAAVALMPYIGQEVADLMAEWLVRSRQFRPVAQEWFTRHGADGAALLIPAALGAPPAQARTAALALLRLDAGDVLAAADALGCRAAVEELLAGDPLNLVPAKVPAVPKWADPALLPQVLLAGRQDALPAGATGALLRMIAMSQLDAPYEGLRVIAGQCDRRSLSDFAWSLYRLWEAQGRPSKDAWAMNALGYFGDESVAERLAPLVRAWPSEGAAPRAKRGADILAVMGSEQALRHLSALARNAKSAPLRTHAAAALDRAAGARGLLPEQLDDLLAPDLGLDGDPVVYRGVRYQVDLAGSAELVLRDPSGQQLTRLPKPADDDEKPAAAAWDARRRKAKPLIADQVARLEEAMVVQRRWTPAGFRSAIACHPLLGRLARTLVWALDDRTVALDSLGDLVDPAGGLAGKGDWVHLAHPAADDFTPWRPWLERLTAPQPFPQAGRETFTGEDPSAYWQRTVPAAALYRLLREGWHWGPAGPQARRYQMFRPFGPDGRVLLTIDPGVSAVSDAKQEPGQTITGVAFESSHGELGVFSDLPRVTRSELVRSLRAGLGSA